MFLGIDAGGTRTVCQLADADLRVMATSRGPGANLQAAGELEVERVLHAVIADALRDAPGSPTSVCLGMAGVDRPRDAAIVRGILNRIATRAHALVVNDALIALEAGVGSGPGIVVIAGTGSIAYGRNSANRAARAGGWGYVLGDEGSGYWLGRQALRSVVRAADGRGPATALTGRVLAHYGVDQPQQLVREIYFSGTKPAAIATLSREVQAAADDGDDMARHIIDVGASELAGAVVSVATRLALGDCDVVLSGGTLLNVTRLREGVISGLAERLPGATVRALTEDPAYGAVRLAAAHADGRSSVPAYLDALT
jgi:glucosamine kinase